MREKSKKAKIPLFSSSQVLKPKIKRIKETVLIITWECWDTADNCQEILGHTPILELRFGFRYPNQQTYVPLNVLSKEKFTFPSTTLS